MPTPPSSARTHFKATDRSCNKSNKFHQCRHCLTAARLAQRVGARSILVEDIRARKENFEAHLEDCCHAPIWAKPSSQDFRPYSRHDEEREWSSSSSGDQSQISDCSQRFDPDVTEEFERLLAEFQADNRLSEAFISRPSTRNLFAFLMALSVASSPSRQVLDGRILDIRRTQFLTEAKDVWMNIARTHLLGYQVSRHGDRELTRFRSESAGQRSEGRESEEIATPLAMPRVEVAEELAPSSPAPVVNDQAVQPETRRLTTSVPMPMASSYQGIVNDQAESERVAIANDQLGSQRLAVKEQELQLKQSELRVKEQELQLKQSELRAKQEESRQKLRAEVLTKLVEAGKSPAEVREYLAIMDPVDNLPSRPV